MWKSGVQLVYEQVVSTVIEQSRPFFLEEGCSEEVLQLLKETWLRKLAERKTLHDNVVSGSKHNNASKPLSPKQRKKRKAPVVATKKATSCKSVDTIAFLLPKGIAQCSKICPARSMPELTDLPAPNNKTFDAVLDLSVQAEQKSAGVAKTNLLSSTKDDQAQQNDRVKTLPAGGTLVTKQVPEIGNECVNRADRADTSESQFKFLQNDEKSEQPQDKPVSKTVKQSKPAKTSQKTKKVGRKTLGKSITQSPTQDAEYEALVEWLTQLEVSDVLGTSSKDASSEIIEKDVANNRTKTKRKPRSYKRKSVGKSAPQSSVPVDANKGTVLKAATEKPQDNSLLTTKTSKASKRTLNDKKPTNKRKPIDNDNSGLTQSESDVPDRKAEESETLVSHSAFTPKTARTPKSTRGNKMQVKETAAPLSAAARSEEEKGTSQPLHFSATTSQASNDLFDKAESNEMVKKIVSKSSNACKNRTGALRRIRSKLSNAVGTENPAQSELSNDALFKSTPISEEAQKEVNVDDSGDTKAIGKNIPQSASAPRFLTSIPEAEENISIADKLGNENKLTESIRLNQSDASEKQQCRLPKNVISKTEENLCSRCAKAVSKRPILRRTPFSENQKTIVSTLNHRPSEAVNGTTSPNTPVFSDAKARQVAEGRIHKKKPDIRRKLMENNTDEDLSRGFSVVRIVLPRRRGRVMENRTCEIRVPRWLLKGTKLPSIITPLIKNVGSFGVSLATYILQQHVNKVVTDRCAQQVSIIQCDGPPHSVKPTRTVKFHLCAKIKNTPVTITEKRLGEVEIVDSDDDETDEENPLQVFESQNLVICQYKLVKHRLNNWNIRLSNGVMYLNGKDYVFESAIGKVKW